MHGISTKKLKHSEGDCDRPFPSRVPPRSFAPHGDKTLRQVETRRIGHLGSQICSHGLQYRANPGKQWLFSGSLVRNAH